MAKSKRGTLAEQKAAAIRKIARDGRVDPQDVIAAARDPKNVLHREFIWDDRKAADAYRLDRARQLIREVKLEISYREITLAAPYFISDPGSDIPSYIETKRIARSGTQARRVLADELARIKGAINRGRSLAIAFNLQLYFDALLDQTIALEQAFTALPDDEGDRPAAS